MNMVLESFLDGDYEKNNVYVIPETSFNMIYLDLF